MKYSIHARRGRRLLRAVALASTLPVLAILAGCSTASTANQTSTAPTGELSAAAKTAAAIVQQASKPTTTLGVTTPLKTKPSSGHTLVYLQCEVPDCPKFGNGAAAAAAAVGWKLKVIPFMTSNPATLITAMNQALAFKPVAVSFVGVPESVWGQEVSKYRSAGVAIMPISVGDVSINSTVPVNISSPSDFTAEGKLAANWVVAQSNGDADALAVDFPAYAVVHAKAASFESTLRSTCSKCKVSSLGISLTQLSTNAVVPAIVSALQRDKSIKYVYSSESELAQGLSSALKTAQLSDVHIIGSSPTVQDFQLLQSGAPDAFILQPKTYIGWQFVDAALRLQEGMQIPTDEGGWPRLLLTSRNVGSTAHIDALQTSQPTNYAAMYKKLWKV